jgi:hypothetical protein
MTKYLDAVKQPKNLSPRVKWLRDYFFEGVNRNWNNEYNCFSNGREWDCAFDELTYHIVPETASFFLPFTAGFTQSGKIVPVDDDFF